MMLKANDVHSNHALIIFEGARLKLGGGGTVTDIGLYFIYCYIFIKKKLVNYYEIYFMKLFILIN